MTLRDSQVFSMKKELVFVLLTSLSTSAFAASAHIADDAYVFTNSGPSNKYRINGRVNSGEPVDVINRSGAYVQVKTANGHVGWLPKSFVASGESDLARMPKLEQELTDSRAKVEEQAEQIKELKRSASTRMRENEDNRAKVIKLNKQISELEGKIENMDESNLISWLTHGGLIALGGVLLGLLVPYLPHRKKSRSDWF